MDANEYEYDYEYVWCSIPFMAVIEGLYYLITSDI